MKHISIKSLLPGCGKSYVLCYIFIKADLQNKKILVPTNKAKQEIINKLVYSFGYQKANAEKAVETMRKFKGNYTKLICGDDGTTTYFNTTTKPKTWKKVWNIFIDEYSMFSKVEIDDLVKNVPIENIITAGDLNQFSPIANKYAQYDINNKVLTTVDGRLLEFNDDGKPADLRADVEYILDTPIRSSNSKINTLANAIKTADFSCLSDNEYFNSIFVSFNDIKNELPYCQSVAYTKRKCKDINSLINRKDKYIAINNNEIIGFSKGEMFNRKQVEKMGEYVKSYLQDNNKLIGDFDIEPWINANFSSAYAVNAHKLQGSSISEKVVIFIDDFINLLEYNEKCLNSAENMLKKPVVDMNITELPDGTLGYANAAEWKTYEEELKLLKLPINERIALFQKYLYVAVTRAVNDVVIVTKNNNLMNKMIKYVKQFKPMNDVFSSNAIHTDSKTFCIKGELPEFSKMNTEELEAYAINWRQLYHKREFNNSISKNKTAIADAKNMKYSEWKEKWKKGRTTYSNLKKIVQE